MGEVIRVIVTTHKVLYRKQISIISRRLNFNALLLASLLNEHSKYFEESSQESYVSLFRPFGTLVKLCLVQWLKKVFSQHLR